MSRTAPRWLAFSLASLLGSGLILHQSAMALTGDAAPPFDAAPAPLVTDASGPLFGGEPLAPGDTTVGCASVRYANGPAVAEVRMLAAVTDAGLAEWLEVRVELGRGGTYSDCSGFAPEDTIFGGTLDELADHDRFDRGLGAWLASPGDVRSYRVTTTLLDGAPVATTADADFHWEVRAP